VQLPKRTLLAPLAILLVSALLDRGEILRYLDESGYSDLAQAVAKRPLRIGQVAQPAAKQGQICCGCGRAGSVAPICILLKANCRTSCGVIPGHQIVGDVVAGAMEGHPVGTRVGVSWIGGIDGTCQYCRRGWRTFAIRQLSRATPWMAGMGSMPWLRSDFAFRFPSRSMICTQLRYCARAYWFSQPSCGRGRARRAGGTVWLRRVSASCNYGLALVELWRSTCRHVGEAP